jgi:hypothetical protein
MSWKDIAGQWSERGRACVGHVSLPGTSAAPPTAGPTHPRAPVGGWGRDSDSRTCSDQQISRLFHSPQDLLPRLVFIHLEEQK